jgi:hypothetical protein
MKHDAVLSSDDPNWKTEARTLMRNKKHFVVEDWEFFFDNRDSTELAREFNYSCKLDPGKQRAFFEPGKSQKAVNYE